MEIKVGDKLENITLPAIDDTTFEYDSVKWINDSLVNINSINLDLVEHKNMGFNIMPFSKIKLKIDNELIIN